MAETILIVDDEAANYHLLEAILTKAGYRVAQADGGTAAFRSRLRRPGPGPPTWPGERSVASHRLARSSPSALSPPERPPAPLTTSRNARMILGSHQPARASDSSASRAAACGMARR
jgi:hypothetical protein